MKGKCHRCGETRMMVAFCISCVEELEAEEHMSHAVNDVLAERRRQVEEEGWSAEHDDQHADGSLAQAAACYALNSQEIKIKCGDYTLWPWAKKWWKPKDRRRDLVRAAALLIAEIERMDRISA